MNNLHANIQENGNSVIIIDDQTDTINRQNEPVCYIYMLIDPALFSFHYK
jgi:Trk K+ transport system NAD-binding subunit